MNEDVGAAIFRGVMDGKATNSGQSHDRKVVNRWSKRPWMLSLFIALVSMSLQASAANLKYCSNSNTGSDFEPIYDIYQSNGACTGVCQGKYAFAILQGSACWCSNYAPADSSASCTEACPGYPSDICGDTDEDAYAYIALAMKPSGTKGASTTKPTVSPTSSAPDDSPTPTISIVTKEKEGSVETVTTISTVKSTTKADETSKSSTSSPTLAVVTRVGGVQTVTVGPTADGAVAPSGSISSEKSTLSGGAIAGVVIGVLFGIILLGVGAFLLWRHRRNAAAMDTESPNEKIAAGGAGIVGGAGRKSRSASVMGLAGSGTKSPNGTALDGHNITPTSSSGAGGSGSEVPYDPRLDPHSLFARYDQTTGSSRMSVRSLRDDADYSRRVLRLANPDTDE